MALIKKFRIKSFKKVDPIIQVKKLSLSFGNRKILDGINFSINKGQILGLLGPNGVGKSTIFNIITGLIKPDFGEVIINSKKLMTTQSIKEQSCLKLVMSHNMEAILVT